jgi:glycerol-3-phosphate acyltransferase PlsY
VAAPAFLWLIGENRLAGLFLVLTLVLWVMHRANIARLFSGTEGRIGQRSSAGT